MPDIITTDAENAIQTVEPEEVKRFCCYCGKEIQANAVFCPFCGNQLENAANQPGVTINQQAINYNQQIVSPVVEQRKVNGVGIAGFICALLSLIVLLFPIFLTKNEFLLSFILYLFGLFFSIVGLFHSPRHFAIVGLIISLVDIFLIVSSDILLSELLTLIGL